MARGTFANIRLKNLLVAPKEGNLTKHFPDGAELPIYDAAMRYQEEGTPCIVLAGKEYGCGLKPGLGGERAQTAGREGRHRRIV